MNKELEEYIKNIKLYDNNEEKYDLYAEVQTLTDKNKLSLDNSKTIIAAIFRGEITKSNFEEQIANYQFADFVLKDNNDEKIQEYNDINLDTIDDKKIEYIDSKSENDKYKKNIKNKLDNNLVDNLNAILSQIGNGTKLDNKKNYLYKVVQAPGKITGSINSVLREYENLLNSNTGDGWMYYSTQSVTQEIPGESGGCSLISPPTPPRYNTVIFLIFVKEKNE